MDPGHRRVGLQRRGALSARHVGELTDELEPLLVGWVVRDVQPLPPRDLLLALVPPPGAPGGGEESVRRLRLSADPEAPRLHLVRGRVRAHRGPVGPFFRQLDAGLAGAALTGLSQARGDRIARLCFEPAAPDRGPTALILELVGRHANLVWVDAEDRVRALLVAPPQRAGDSPRLAEGSPWRPPPGTPPDDPGPPLAEALPAPEGPADPLAPLSARVEASLGSQAEAARLATLRRDLNQRLKRRRRNAERTLAGLAERRQAAGQAERLRQDGELLKAVAGGLKRGQREARVQDWFAEGTPERRIELDPKLTPQQNVERCFRRYRKLLRTAEGLDADETRAQEQLRATEALQERLAEPEADPEALEAEALEAGLLSPRQEAGPPARRPKPAPRQPYKAFRSQAGTAILVGRSARDNDELSLKVARGSDVWLHTADAPGSHVVLRTERGVEPDPEDVLDAAHLALHFSPLRGAARADIHVARCKEVKKPKRAPAGLVTLSGGRTLHLRSEPERLARLLDGRR